MATTTLRDDHLEIARRHALPDDWPSAPRFNPVDRWYTRLAAHPDHEVWLLTWLPGQGTDLHDHGGSAGALYVVSGALAEEVADPARPARPTARHLAAGDGHRFGPRYIHRITNRSQRPAVSVHVYGPALTTMTRYRETPAGLAVAEVARAGEQW
ncbi:hypothetical protein GCM10010123_41300 [Pilimelia anulata]|uniref:Cysteine dioxygenase n=1 Tax=Pilimelia anulata TaxID=53371 RepID=A0A8J3BJ23_9ACTN|nr:cysteine dioxygenase family protein [Pilimelia anulata]GGK07200.1 hypothetical protein GCM10010123_41300 [Pilimelia anulata]